MAGIYIHVPFCVRKCDYCSFVSYANRSDVWSDYISCVCRELAFSKERLSGEHVETVYFGGGTPSLLPEHEFARMLNEIAKHYALEAKAELTFEMNPATIDGDKLKALRRLGLNRASIGVQSFDDALLKSIGRIHTAAQARSSITLTKEAGFDNVSIDLIYALPGQTSAQWSATLEQAVATDVPHISAYSLIVEEGTMIHARVEKGELQLPDEDRTVKMQRLANRLLANHGIERYEISNYARRGFASRHNTLYWKRAPYLGVGCAAHSFTQNERTENPAELDVYMSMVQSGDIQARLGSSVAPAEAIEECILLETRLCEGLDLKALCERFGYDLLKDKKQTIRRLTDAGMVRCTEDKLILTETGMEVHNAIVLALVP